MSFRIRQIGGIAHVKHFGTLTIVEMEEAVSALTEQYVDQPLQGLLVDFTSVTAIADKAAYLRWIDERGGITPFTARAAFVAGDTIADVVDFMVLATQNRGHVVWNFDSAEEALHWLQRPSGAA